MGTFSLGVTRMDRIKIEYIRRPVQLSSLVTKLDSQV